MMLFQLSPRRLLSRAFRGHLKNTWYDNCSLYAQQPYSLDIHNKTTALRKLHLWFVECVKLNGPLVLKLH